MRFPRVIVMLAAAVALGAGGGAAVVALAGGDDGATTTVTATQAAPAPVQVAGRAGGGALTAGEVYAHAKDSIAFITARVVERQQASPFGPPLQREGQSTGTGFVVSDDGHVVTNAHVVAGATSATVKIGDGDPLRAEVVGRDESTDLALLKVPDRDGARLRPLALADSDDVQVGDPVYAIGNPFGLDRTLTTGVVSALQRQITAPNGFSIDGVIQTDASINPGNSGGPLLDARGAVIGVNSQIVNAAGSSQAGNVGIGFAVPSNTVRNVIEQLERDGRVEHAYLGIQMGDLADGDGVLVGVVKPGSPAERAGLREGDVITAYGGRKVDNTAALAAAVNASRVGDRVELEIRRGGRERTIAVTLGRQPASASDPAGAAPGRSGRDGPIDPRELLERLMP